MKLSIVTISYNNVDGLRKTIDTVLAQESREAFEYVVVDGGSKDGTLELLQSHDSKIDKWVSEPDKGIYNAMNKGVGMATGDYCLFLNSGDCFHSNTVVSEILDYLSDIDFVIGKVLFLNSMQTSNVAEPLTMNRFYNGSVPHPATFIRTDLLRKYPYDESYRIVSDWKFFLQTLILDSCSYKLIDNVITDFDTEGISATNKALVDKERSLVLKELLPDRIVLDYLQFNKGSGYKDTPYDRFFIKLRDYKYGRFLYKLDLLIMRIVAVFKKGAAFAKNFPFNY